MTSNTSASSDMDAEKDAKAVDAVPVNDAHLSNEKTAELDKERQSDSDVEQGVTEKPQGPPPGAFDPRQ